ncbi:MAG TPA: site-specific integrase [Cyclobacteriaceae bacterium]|nr:site-specific integrase [Cyclobacteriaceae bacterium]
MKKNEVKKKEPVKLRQRELANGNYTLYLDIYWKGQREYDYLNLYVKKSNKASDNEQNRQTLLLADQIRARRIIDLQSGKYKLKQPKTDISFIDYFNKLKTDRLNSKGNFGNWDSAYKHLLKFMNGKDVTLVDVDETWLMAFRHYLLQDAKIGGGDIKLSQNSALSYFNKVKAALRQAFEEKLIRENPAQRVRGIKPAETKREFLTWEEVQRISKTKCDVRKLKEAFLFSIMTGLRWSDIIKMTWSEVRGSNAEGWYIRFQQQKTRDYEVLPIKKQARELLGKKGGADQRVFIGLKYSNYTNIALTRWMKVSGIDREITFHCARHTHATLLLNQGVDIYVVSKLLGHKNIKTTEIYAKVSQTKKIEAVNKLPQLDIVDIGKQL